MTKSIFKVGLEWRIVLESFSESIHLKRGLLFYLCDFMVAMILLSKKEHLILFFWVKY